MAVNRSAVTSAFFAAEIRPRTALGGSTCSEIESSAIASLISESWSEESAIEKRGGRFASRARRRNRRSDHEWKVPM